MQRYLLLWLLLSSAVALAWPWMVGMHFDPLVASKPYLLWMIAGIMFSLGWMLPSRELQELYQRWPAVVGGTTLQYVSMPLLAVTFGWLLALPYEQYVGIVVVGCVPGAMASNVLTHLARGHTSYSVSLTTLATLLSPLVVPLSLSLALQSYVEIDLNPWREAYTLLISVVLPVATGKLLAGWLRRFEAWTERAALISANILLLWVIATVVAINRETLLSANMGWRAPLALVLVNVFGYLAGYVGGVVLGLPESMRRALTIEIGMQNAGLGAVVAMRILPHQPPVAILPAAYMLGCMVTGTLLAQWWSHRPPQSMEVTVETLSTLQ